MAKNDESSKPFDSFRLNVPFQDSFLIPNSGADAASTIPGEPLIVMTSGSNENLPVEANNMFRSNMIMSRNGGLIMYTSTDQTSALGDISVWDDSPRDLWNHTKAAEKFKIRTKDFDFDGSPVSGPSIRKKVYKIYVTFKCSQYMSGVKINYATNGSNSFTGTFEDTTYYTNAKGFDSYNAGTSTSQWVTVGLKPSSSINNVYSIALQLSHANAGHVGKLAASDAVGDSTITLSTNASGTNDYYNGMPIFFYGGNGYGQIRTITDYIGATRVATLSSALTIAVDTSTLYDIGYIHSSFQINDIAIVYREKAVK
tara:strand:- start:3288 stop:4226 length:939 start_codon:yes stop_codon:yes gene_type:complete